MTERAKKLLLLYYKQSRKIRRVSGLPPLSFKALAAGTLENYRIYGNTVDGESVGDRTGNLFDYSTVTTGYRILWATGQPNPDATATISDYIAVNSGTYAVNSRVFVACYDNSKNYLGIYSANGYVKDYSPPVNYIVLNSTCSYIRIFDYNLPGVSDNTISQTTMLNEGSTALPYEPYGYKVTVTVEGKNLFNGFSVHGKVPSVSDGELTNSPSGGATTDFIAIDNGDITLSKSYAAQSNMYVFLYEQDKSYIGYSQTTNSDTLILHGNSINGYQNAKYARIRVDIESFYMQTNIMLNTGSTALPYEPYHAPVTTPIYLPEPLKMVGDEAEYIDYAEQQFHRISDSDLDVTLPALPVLPGTNTLTVGTEVQPSSVEIKGRIKAAGGD